ncbi:MAG TPA: response regulator transcription factor [Actinopolymorphaceae bacterium]
MPIRVFIVEDHEVVRIGVRQLLAAEPDVEVVGEAATSAQARARIPVLRPDVAILDVRLPDEDGVLVCRDIRSRMLPPPACLMLTSFSDDDALSRAVLAGAAGYLLKQVRGSDIVGAVRRVARGESLLDPGLVDAAWRRLRRDPGSADGGTASADVSARVGELSRYVHHDDRYATLTRQEQRVLELIARGMTNRQIAETLYLAEKTVKNYVSRLLRKLGMDRRTEAAVYAVERSQRLRESRHI